ncbi:MAG: S8 family serine peptidase, partial [Candidatus Sericytochromatia bacterium]|nr:S8 family serine peptidase [Candidatus Tanganyikabacteria bacterium]
GGRAISDPLAGEQWGLEAVGASRAWNRTLGNPDVVVAVVDTGVDLGHPDLRNRLVSGISFVTEVPGEEGAAAENPYRLSGPMDDNGHGTHVAGIVAAEANNAEGGAGVAPNCRIMPVKVLAYNTRGFDGDVSAGIVWAVDHGARIVNMSLGGEGGGRTLERAIQYANARGVLVVAAMGNDGEDPAHNYGTNLNYPAAYNGVVAVAAVGPDDSVASFSNRGRWCTVAGPGTRILSTTPTYEVYDPVMTGYDRLDGTSMATPFVSGIAALALSAKPGLDAGGLKRLLEATSRDILFPGFDFSTGHGLVDAAAAVLR